MLIPSRVTIHSSRNQPLPRDDEVAHEPEQPSHDGQDLQEEAKPQIQQGGQGRGTEMT